MSDALITPLRKLLYVWACNFAARIAPEDVREVHNEVFSLGLRAYEKTHSGATP
jgi:hypothetical protein